MKTSDFKYDLPKELIAQDPLQDRTSSRLLILNRRDGSLRHDVFRNIGNYLEAGDCLVLNDTKVIPARLIGVKEDTGAAVEVLLLKRLNSESEERLHSNKKQLEEKQTDRSNLVGCRENVTSDITVKEKVDTWNCCVWECIVRPGRKLREGARIIFGGAPLRQAQGAHEVPIAGQGAVAEPVEAPLLTAEILKVLPDGNRLIRFIYDGIWEEVLDALGEMPLPPYITHKLEDKNRYQTVYAKNEGSAAAPTAGLHFTKELLQELQEKGIRVAYVTLHVGLGTFRPVKVEDVTKHHMHSEWYSVPEETLRMIHETKAAGRRVVCVGTTSCRTLESVAGEVSYSGETDIFIYPGFEFKVTDALITNFHLPESTLLMLVSAFASREQILHAYEEAVRKSYRFFSFGDAMLIL